MKKRYIYPARFIEEDNGAITVYFPDLEGCQTYCDTIEGAALMAQKALKAYIETLLELRRDIPQASNLENVSVDKGHVMLVIAEVKAAKKSA